MSALQVSQPDLEERLREVTQLLYEKQEQYEKMSAERTFHQFAMEAQLKNTQEQLDAVHRKYKKEASANHRSTGIDSIIPMDSLGDTFYKLSQHKRVGRAVRTGALFLDNSASKLVHLLRQYPLWRLGVFLYLTFIHLYCYALITRLQTHVVSD